ncbi:hypothetical protein LRP67_17125 [Nocardioides sp. cx-169]|uniref:hypothetical protein n=1 Tax=Nocardioides sp. cx-169 TaxID=2899080 RepID=UPI001E4B7A51|nr:hypothetical protein [Nocardioides sp. cx-169]MCD4535814.1 hypothetical protein [Nocardioides sp. cx-169]
MRASSLAVLLLLAPPLLAACGEDEEAPEQVEAKALPANLCTAVPAAVVERWALVEDVHDTTESADENKATCTMSGTVRGAPVTLELSLSSFAADDDDAVRERMEEALEERCSRLESDGTGQVTEEDGRCAVESPPEPEGERGAVTEYSLARAANGISSVTMVHHGPLFGSVGAEVVGIGGTISQTDPADLG